MLLRAGCGRCTGASELNDEHRVLNCSDEIVDHHADLYVADVGAVVSGHGYRAWRRHIGLLEAPDVVVARVDFLDFASVYLGEYIGCLVGPPRTSTPNRAGLRSLYSQPPRR